MKMKELQKLRRQDLLELLLMQGKETEELQKELEEMKERLGKEQEYVEYLKGKLEEKDKIVVKLINRQEETAALIRRFKKALVLKEATIKELRMQVDKKNTTHQRDMLNKVKDKLGDLGEHIEKHKKRFGSGF